MGQPEKWRVLWFVYIVDKLVHVAVLSAVYGLARRMVRVMVCLHCKQN